MSEGIICYKKGGKDRNLLKVGGEGITATFYESCRTQHSMRYIFFLDFIPRNVYHCWGMLIVLYRQMQLAVCVLGHLIAAEQILKIVTSIGVVWWRLLNLVEN